MMTRGVLILAAGTLLLKPTPSLPSTPGSPAPFAIASINLEQNATDGDFEVVVEAMGGDDGLAKLTVTAPNGRAVIDVTAPAATTLGVRQLRFESPEPGDLASLQAGYPEGEYTFTGATATGVTLEGKATLRHALPAAPAGIRVNNGAITWTAARSIAAYIVTIEQDGSDVSITARLPGSAARFAAPDGFLRPATAYVLGIGAVAADGNASFVERTFRTPDKGAGP